MMKRRFSIDTWYSISCGCIKMVLSKQHKQFWKLFNKQFWAISSQGFIDSFQSWSSCRRPLFRDTLGPKALDPLKSMCWKCSSKYFTWQLGISKSQTETAPSLGRMCRLIDINATKWQNYHRLSYNDSTSTSLRNLEKFSMAWDSSSVSSCMFIDNDNLHGYNLRMVLSRKIHQSDAFIFQSKLILFHSRHWNSFIRHYSPS